MFMNDYSEMVHPRILQAINKYSLENNVPYGLDKHSDNASNYIRSIFKCPNAEIHYLAGGTQTNMTVISHILKDYEGVISVDGGHINVHETASVEGSGHKVYTVKGRNGKLFPEDIENALKINHGEHMVKLKMAYISNSTEIGTIYTKQELINLYKCCKKHNLYLFMDGARLGVALTCKENDLSAEDIAKYTDVFYIGGTKNGFLIGESVVIVNDDLKENFRYQIKNKGAMLAKGYVLGIEFEEAFKDGLYFEIAKNANERAEYIQNNLLKLGCDLSHSPTNQIFVNFNKDLASKIINKYGCELWNSYEEKDEIRIVTSFTTTKEECDELILFVKNNL